MTKYQSLIDLLETEASKYNSNDIEKNGIHDGLMECARWIDGAHDIDGIIYEGKNMIYSSQYYETEMKTAESDEEMLDFKGMSKGFDIGAKIVSDWLYDKGY